MQRSTELQNLFSEIVKLARVSGSHEARLTRAETDIQRLSTVTTTAMPSMGPSTGTIHMREDHRHGFTRGMRDMRTWIELSRLTAKVVLWLAPRLLMAWAAMSGWFAAAWRWVQTHYGYLLWGLGSG